MSKSFASCRLLLRLALAAVISGAVAACVQSPPIVASALSRAGSAAMMEIRSSEIRMIEDINRVEAVGVQMLRSGPVPPDPQRWQALVMAPGQALLQKDLLFESSFQWLSLPLNWEQEDKRTAVQAALVEWTVLLRRGLMGSQHSRTPGLELDPDCSGDLLADGSLLSYFEALSRDDDLARFQAVQALSELGRQSACLGADQAEALAQAMADAFDQLELRLLSRRQSDVLTLVVQALAQPLLVLHDVEKYKGANAPLMRWFQSQHELLRLGALSGRLPAEWHGLWLYDRRSGRMLGFRHRLQPADENEVDLVRLIDSWASFSHLGEGRCALSEMVLRGATASGYYCAGAACGPSGKAGGLLATFGDYATVPPEVCSAGFGGNSVGGSGAGSGASACRAGVTLGESARAAGQVQCLSRQVVRPGTAGFSCVAEATGLCASPQAGFVKDLGGQTYAGARPTPMCTLSETSSGAGEAWDRYQREVDGTRKAYQAGLQESRELVAKAVDAYTAARKAWDEASVKEARGEGTAEDTQKAHDAEQQAAENMNKVIAAETAAREKAAKEREEALQASKKDRDAKLKSGGTRCADPDSCGNGCSALTQALLSTLQCVASSLEAPQRDPYGPTGGCDPRVCDPMESPESSGARLCLAGVDASPLSVVAKTCWAVRCPNGESGGLNGAGNCVCSAVGAWGSPAQMPNLCEVARCTGDGALAVGTTLGGGCGCTSFSSFGALAEWRRGTDFGGLLQPRSPPVVGVPKSLTDINPRLQF